MTITLDIGGEGRHPRAVNLNRYRHKTLGPKRGEPIPNLIVGHAERIPMADRSISHVIVERTPLSQRALAEIARVIAPGATIELVHVPLPDEDRHARALKMLHGKVERSHLQIAGQWVQRTRIEFGAT